MGTHTMRWPWACLLLSVMTRVHAAEGPLTLDDAVALAVNVAPQIAAQHHAVEGAQAMAVSAGRLPDPEAVVGVDNLPTNGPDAYSLNNDFMTMSKIGVMQTFPSARKRRSQRQEAQDQVSVAKSEVLQTQLTISQSAAQAWISSYAAQLALKDLLDLKVQIDLQAQSARAAVTSGRGSALDALTAQAGVADLDDRILEARRSVASARAELARWIGDAAGRALAAPPSFRDLPAHSQDLRASLPHHAALLTYDTKIVAARSAIEVARAEKRPDWSVEIDYARRGPNFSNLVSLEFKVGLPLWPRYRQNPAIDEKRAKLAALEADRETELRMHTAELTQALADWRAARDRIDLYERERLPLAHQRTQLALAGFQAGRMDLRQTLATFSEEIELRRGYAEMFNMFGRAWASLNYLPAQAAAP
jgi:cobalt-zinc-cadmium efflux system outer membrane protein